MLANQTTPLKSATNKPEHMMSSPSKNDHAYGSPVSKKAATAIHGGENNAHSPSPVSKKAPSTKIESPLKQSLKNLGQ